MDKPLKAGDMARSVVQQALAGVTMVTANRHAAHELMLACERDLKKRGPSWQTPRVISWSGWIESLWSEQTLFAAHPPASLNATQQRMLWKSVISKVRPRGFLDLDGAAALCAGAWELMQQYRLPRERADFQLSAETRFFFECAQRYLQTTERNGWTDSARLPDEVRARLDLDRLPHEVVFFGFDAVTPQQKEFWDFLAASGVVVQERRCEVEQLHPPVKSGFLSVEDELRAAAHWARARLEDSPEARIGIVVPQLAQLLREAEHIFEQVFYPDSSARRSPVAAYHLSLGPPLSEYPAARTALTALRWAAGPLPVSEIGYLMRSPYGAAGGERAARDMLELELRSVAPQLSLKQAADLLSSASFRAKCPALTGAIVGSQQTMEHLQERNWMPSSWADGFSTILKQWGWPGEAPDSHEFQIAEKFRELLNEMSTLDAVSGPMTLADAVETFTRMAESTRFRPEDKGAAVLVSGVWETAGCCFDHLWITGMSDAGWPLRAYADPLLPFHLQRQHRLPNSSAEQQLEFAQRIFERLMRSGAEVVVSWPQTQEQEVLGPCASLAGIEEAVTEVAVAPAWAEAQLAQGEMETFVDGHAPAPAPGPRRGGARLLELQSACPFRAVMEFRLGADEPQEASLSVDARHRGGLVDMALNYAWEQFKTKENYRDHMTDAERDPVFRQAVDNALAELPPARAPWQLRHYELERDRLIALLKEWFALDTQREEHFKVWKRQEKVAMNFAGLELTGVIDRIDQLGDGSLVILDYKTGEKERPANWEGSRPEKPQLPAYVLSQQREKISAVAFAQVRTGNCRFKGYAVREGILNSTSYKPRDRRSFSEHVADWEQSIEDLARRFLEGGAAADPRDPVRTCAHCHLPGVCRIAENVTISSDKSQDDEREEYGDE